MKLKFAKLKRIDITGLILIIGLFFIYHLAGNYWSPRQRPAGDEPHYLLIAQSLLRDHDLDLKNNYDQSDYQIWGYPKDSLDRHFSVNSTGNRQMPLHNIGWPIFLVPFIGFKGITGARFLAEILGALTALNVYLLIKKITNTKATAITIAIITALTIPLATYSNQIFSDIFAAFLIIYGVRKLWERLPNFSDNLFLILALSVLPWIHVKYITVSLFFILIFIYLNWRKKRRYFLGLIYFGSLALMGYFFYRSYGSPLPSAQYPQTFGLKLAEIPRGVTSLLLDQHFGLLVYSPLYIFALAGLIFTFLKDRFLGFLLSMTFLLVFLLQAAGAIYIGWSPVGRFFVAVSPILAISMGALYPTLKKWNLLIFWFLSGWSFLASYFLIKTPGLNYSASDPLFLEQMSSKLINFKAFFPKILAIEKYLPMTSSDRQIIAVWLIIIAVLTASLLIFREPFKLSTPSSRRTKR